MVSHLLARAGARRRARALAAVACALGGCSGGPGGSTGPDDTPGGASGGQVGTDVGNGADVKMKMKAYEQRPPPGSKALLLASGATIDTLYAVFEDLRFEPGTICSERDDHKIDVEGPLVADLLTGDLVVGDGAFGADGNVFCRVRFGLAKLDTVAPPAGSPADLAGLSLRMTGTLADGRAFSVATELGQGFDLDPKGGTLTLGATQGLFVGFDLGPWMTALDLAGASGDPVVVDKESEPDRLSAFEKSIDASAALFKDADGDGKLGADEDDPEDVLAK
jgi:hypothetical protein